MPKFILFLFAIIFPWLIAGIIWLFWYDLYSSYQKVMTSFLSYFALIFTIFILFFQKSIDKYFNRPKLEIKYEAMEPYCIKIPVIIKDKNGKESQTKGYYFRLAVTNKNGNGYAENVEAFIESSGKSIPSFVPRNLDWVDNDRKIFYPKIHKGLSKFLGFGHVIEPTSRLQDAEISCYTGILMQSSVYFNIDTIVQLYSLDRNLYTGKYEYIITLCSDTTKPSRFKINLAFGGKWHDEPEKMLNKSKDEFEKNQGVWIEVRNA